MEQWREVYRIADLALDLPAEKRPALLASECGEDSELRRDVECFLDACDSLSRDGGFLAQPARAFAQALVESVDSWSGNREDILLEATTSALAGRYKIIREIGRGGMAAVFLATVSDSEALVAIKVLFPGLSRQLTAPRFLQEIEVIKETRHPNIIPLLDADTTKGVLYYAMPYIEGGTLRDRVRHEGQLPLPEVVRIARDAAAALDAAHARGIVHRDVKPANILLDKDRALVADFGVALAMERAGDERLTKTGILIGTVAYMSPEQAAGERHIDVRSDVYALACVVYEMLTGEAPYSGASDAVRAKHLLAPIPDARYLRGSVTEKMQRVLARGLAKSAADRYPSAGQFVRDLESAIEATPRRGPRPRSRRASLIALSAASLALVATGLAVWKLTLLTGLGAPRVDTSRIVVVPVGPGSAGNAASSTGLLNEAVSQWSDVNLVSPIELSESLRDHVPIQTKANAAELGISLRAGRVILERVSAKPDGKQLDAVLYDVATRSVLSQAQASVPSNPDSAKVVLANVARSLLLRGATLPDDAIGANFGHSLVAAQWIIRGHRALAEWDLARADSAFETALRLDMYNAGTSIALAQVRFWRDLPADDWAPFVGRAQRAAAALSLRDRRLADALTLLAKEQYEAACAVYNNLLIINKRDFAAWYGLGQCRWADKRVVASRASPSGFRFRSSYDSALTAFIAAFDILPSSLRGYESGAYDRLRQLLLLSTIGVPGEDSTGATYYGRPGWIGNRLVLVPYPWRAVADGGAPATPPGFALALQRQRTRFRGIAARWSAAFPRSAGAKRAVSLALELNGDAAAIDTLRLARMLTADPQERARLIAAEALLLLKFGAPDRLDLLRRAAAVADSLLDNPDMHASAEPATLLPIAALRGRCDLADSLARKAAMSAESGELSRYVVAETEGALARASLGCRMAQHSIADVADRVTREVEPFAPDQRRRLTEALLRRPVLLVVPLDSSVLEQVGKDSPNQFFRAARALTRHESTDARTVLAAIDARWPADGGPVTPDVTLPGARMWVSLADTATAISWLDKTLAQLPSYDPQALGDHAIIASLIGTMVLRAELAASRGESRTARRWAAPVTVLWSKPHPDLAPVVRQMSEFATR